MSERCPKCGQPGPYYDYGYPCLTKVFSDGEVALEGHQCLKNQLDQANKRIDTLSNAFRRLLTIYKAEAEIMPDALYDPPWIQEALREAEEGGRD